MVAAYLKGGSERSSDTGGRKFYDRRVIERYQLMGESGRSQFDASELSEFRPRFDSPPYPVSDMLIVDPAAVAYSLEADLSFQVRSEEVRVVVADRGTRAGPVRRAIER